MGTRGKFTIYAKPNNILQFGDIKPKQADYNSPLIAVY